MDAPHAFLHIESTGGTTFGAILHRIAPGPVLHLGTDDQRSTEEIHRTFSTDTVAGCTVVLGHLDQGVCARVPMLRPMTLLRDPVDRLVSTYRRYLRSTDPGSAFWHDEIVRDQLSVVAFARHPLARYALTQTQTRQLAGAIWSGDQLLPEPELLDRAVANLRSFAYVGILERWQDSLRLLADLWDLPAIDDEGPRNVAPDDGIEITASEREALAELSQLDEQLYRVGSELFADRLLALDQRS